MVFVLDASAILAAFYAEIPAADVRRMLERIAADGIVVPAIFPFEVANSLEMGRRRARIDSERIAGFMRDLAIAPIQIQIPPTMPAMDAIRALAERLRLTVYDAAYLALALSEGLELVTLDKALLKAASATGVKASSS